MDQPSYMSVAIRRSLVKLRCIYVISEHGRKRYMLALPKNHKLRVLGCACGCVWIPGKRN